jgi:hypothetical protein
VSDSAALFFRRFPRRAILLDSNLLLLMITGSFDVRLIGTFKRLSGFTVRDFEILSLLASEFETVVSTLHVLTEVNGLADKLPSWSKPEWYEHFARGIQMLEERHIPAKALSALPEFRIFGITDAVLSLVAGETLFVTADDRLRSHLQRRPVYAASFDEIRAIYPREA